MIASTTGMSEVWMARASARSPRSTAATIAAYCSPATWPTTETTPVAPSASSGRLSASSPLNHSRSVAAMTWVEAHRSPLASLTAAMLRVLGEGESVSVLNGMPVRAGMS